MNKIIKYVILTLIAIPVILYILYWLLIIAYFFWHNYENNQILKMNKFDQKLWMKSIREDGHLDWDHKANCTRGKMYYDLVDHYLKKGMSKEEVFELLGRPAYGLKYPNNKKRQYCLEYELGGCSIRSGPGRILSICLKNNRVIEIFHDSYNNDAKTFKIE